MEKNKRKILGITGMRSEYDLQYSIAKSLNSMPNIDFGFVAFGAHLSDKYGKTIKNIESDGFKIKSRIGSLLDSDSEYAKAKSASILMMGLADVFENERPDMILVVGDREETLVASTLATYMSIPISHVFGGDRTFPEGSGDIDEQVRHATTKLAHMHFPIHEDHRRRIIALGEEDWRVQNLGSPALDKYFLESGVNLSSLEIRFGCEIKERSYAVLIHHSLPSDIESSVFELKAILASLRAKNIPTFASFPNSDPGNSLIIEVLKETAKAWDNLHLYRNLDRPHFHGLIRGAAFLIGNSSMGLLECPILEMPAINIGKRQKERINAGNVIFANGDIEEINQAIDQVRSAKFLSRCKDVRFAFGRGDSGIKIAEAMANVEINTKLLAKKMTY